MNALRICLLISHGVKAADTALEDSRTAFKKGVLDFEEIIATAEKPDKVVAQAVTGTNPIPQPSQVDFRSFQSDLSDPPSRIICFERCPDRLVKLRGKGALFNDCEILFQVLRIRRADNA